VPRHAGTRPVAASSRSDSLVPTLTGRLPGPQVPGWPKGHAYPGPNTSRCSVSGFSWMIPASRSLLCTGVHTTFRRANIFRGKRRRSVFFVAYVAYGEQVTGCAGREAHNCPAYAYYTELSRKPAILP